MGKALIKIPELHNNDYDFLEVLNGLANVKIKSNTRQFFLTQENINIHNKDCLEFLKTIPSNTIDFVLTDPPYFLDKLDNNWDDALIQKSTKKSKTIGGLPVGMKFDKQQGKNLQEFFYKVSLELIRVLKPGGFMVAFSQGRLIHRLAVASEDAGFEIRDLFAWQHGGGQGKAFTQNHFVKKMNIDDDEKKSIISKLDKRKTPQLRPEFEPMILAQKPKEGTHIDNWLKYKTGLVKIDFDNENYQQTTIFKYEKPHKNKEFEHMTIKPLNMFQKLIEIFTVENQIVLDPFLGSGTCAEAALMQNRKIYGSEIEVKYFDNILKRINNYIK